MTLQSGHITPSWFLQLGLPLEKQWAFRWSPDLIWTSFGFMMLIALLSFMLTPFVAFFASAGGGYLPPLGWAFLTMVLSQIAIVLGWGGWFRWAFAWWRNADQVQLLVLAVPTMKARNTRT